MARTRVVLLCLGLGCAGAVGDAEESAPQNGPAEQPKSSPGRTPACAASPVEGRLRRLTRAELNNTFRDLFADTRAPADTLDLEPQVGAFYNSYADLWVDKRFLDKYGPVAASVADRAAANVRASSPCAWDADESRCVRTFVTAVGERILRQPLPEVMQQRYVQLFSAGRAGRTIEDGAAVVLNAMLLAPEFLYRGEGLLSTQDARGPYQMAAQLSYLLWASTPDEELLAAARAGRLRTRTEVEAQARRLLGSPKARDGALAFFEPLMEVPKYEFMEKDPAAYPDFGPALVEEMKAETRAFLSHVVFDGDGRLETLLTAPFSFPSARLARLYGVTPAEPLRMTPLPARERAGLLTHAGLLAHLSPKAGTKPVTRGTFVLKTLLCTELTPPEDAAQSLATEVATADATTRQKFELHTTRPDCAACHRLLDPIGFGLETYDGIGRYRTREGPREVDARGVLVGTGDQDGPFSGAVELTGKLARSRKLHECVATQYFRFAFGRREREADRCVLEKTTAAFTGAGLNLKALMLATVTSDAFLERARQ